MNSARRHPTPRGNPFPWKWLSAVLIIGLCAGCNTTQQTPKPSLGAAFGMPSGTPLTIGVLEADITLRELAAGGKSQERDDWSEIARKTARDTLETMRPENYVYFVDEEVSDEVQAEIDEVQAFYRNAILNDIAYMPPPTRSRPQFGSVDTIADAVGADALMLVYGVDDILTTDRKVLTALGLLVPGMPIMLDDGVAHLNAALLSRDGRLIWYNRIHQDQISDLREPKGVKKTLRNLLRTMPQTQLPGGSPE